MARQFGLSRTDGSSLGGNKHSIRPPYAPNTTRRNPSIPPLPAQSLRVEPMLDSDRETAATVFVIGFYAFVLALLVVCVGIIKFCS